MRDSVRASLAVFALLCSTNAAAICRLPEKGSTSAEYERFILSNADVVGFGMVELNKSESEKIQSIIPLRFFKGSAVSPITIGHPPEANGSRQFDVSGRFVSPSGSLVLFALTKVEGGYVQSECAVPIIEGDSRELVLRHFLTRK